MINSNEYFVKKRKFNKITMKKGWTIPVQVYLQLKERRRWETGLTSNELRKSIKKALTSYGSKKRKRKISKGTIVTAVAQLNFFRDDIYIRNDWKNIKVKKKKSEIIIKEYHYFNIRSGEDKEKTRKKLEREKFRNQVKNEELKIFERIDKEEKEIVILKNPIRDLN